MSIYINNNFHNNNNDTCKYVNSYLAEFQSGDVRKESASKALEAYQAATTVANQNLAPTHPIRLGLALNFSVFYYEILNSPNNACSLAKQVILINYKS
jgi:hypothetical protein